MEAVDDPCDFSGARKILQATMLSEICKPSQHITLLEHNLTVAQALKTLAKQQILSAPMVSGAR